MVDAALGDKISPKGLQAHGGWSDPQTPLKIYAEHEASYARGEAKGIRAKIRGVYEESDRLRLSGFAHPSPIPAHRSLRSTHAGAP